MGLFKSWYHAILELWEVIIWSHWHCYFDKSRLASPKSGVRQSRVVKARKCGGFIEPDLGRQPGGHQRHQTAASDHAMRCPPPRWHEACPPYIWQICIYTVFDLHVLFSNQITILYHHLFFWAVIVPNKQLPDTNTILRWRNCERNSEIKSYVW